MVSVQLPEQAAPVEEGLDRHQTEVANWSYHMPCPGVKYYAYEDRPVPIEPPGPREASLQKDGVA
jgi:hypothetical protein